MCQRVEPNGPDIKLPVFDNIYMGLNNNVQLNLYGELTPAC